MKWSCILTNPTTTTTTIEIYLYLRLSHLGDSVVTEIDRPFAFPSYDHFYAQEASNCTTAYECRELDSDDVKPSAKPDPYTLALHAGVGLVCECTDEQRNRLMMMGQDMQDAETMVEVEEEKVEKKVKKRKMKDRGTLTDAETEDKGTETPASRSSEGKSKFFGFGNYERIWVYLWPNPSRKNAQSIIMSSVIFVLEYVSLLLEWFDMYFFFGCIKTAFVI